jgi:hypothetical protein
MLVTKLAELLHLDAVGVIPFVLAGSIVSLFAVCASQRNNYPHCRTPPELTINKKIETCIWNRIASEPIIKKTYLGLPETLYHKQ